MEVWHKEKEEHGDKGHRLIEFDHELDLKSLKKDKNKVLEDLRLLNITKLIKNLPDEDSKKKV